MCIPFDVVEMPERRVEAASSASLSQTMSLCQEAVIKWFANYTMSVRKPAADAAAKPRY